MKAIVKRVVAISMVLALVATLAPISVPQAEAATKKYTMLVGEKMTISTWGSSIKSLKSSKSSVVKATKKGSKVTLKAKKAGTSKVTIKGANNSLVYKITVKKLNIKATYKGVSTNGYSEYAYFEVVNKTGTYISSAYLSYQIKDVAGTVLKKADDAYVSGLVPNAKTYVKIYISSDIAATAASIEVTSAKASHSPTITYTNQTSKVTAKFNEADSTISYTSKSSKSVTAKADLVLYDAAGNIVDVEESSAYLSAKGKDTKSVYISSSVQYSSYELFVRAYA